MDQNNNNELEKKENIPGPQLPQSEETIQATPVTPPVPPVIHPPKVEYGGEEQENRVPPIPNPPPTYSSYNPNSQQTPQYPVAPPTIPPQPQYGPYDSGSEQKQQNEPYRWDYNRYENFNKAPKAKKSNGFVAFLAAFIGSLILGVVMLGVVSFWDAPIPVGDSHLAPGPDDDALEAVTPEPNGNNDIKDKEETPSEELVNPPKGQILTVPQRASKVTPSVVGIIRYQNTLFEPTGIGSGIIIDKDDEYAYIVSNAHVVENGTDFKVRLNDATEYDAQLIGADVASDIAVLRIKTDDKIVPAEIGDSEALLVGETVIAIGNPVSTDLSGSVTQGIVSALDRKLTDDNTINYIQIDAAINPGNSGGALVNEYGQVVGINSMKISGAGYEGIGFAIPMASALPIMDEIREVGHVASRPVLGITGIVVSELEARQMEIPAGIMVVEIDVDAEFSPGIREQDIITHADGERILSLGDLKKVLNNYAIGDEIELTVYRRTDTVTSEELTITVTLMASKQ